MYIRRSREQMTGSIKSDASIARDAVSHYGNSKNTNSEQTSFGQSNLTGMTKAKKLSNKIVDELVKLQSGVKKQADKFPKLATEVEQRDKQDAKSILNNNKGNDR